MFRNNRRRKKYNKYTWDHAWLYFKQNFTDNRAVTLVNWKVNTS